MYILLRQGEFRQYSLIHYKFRMGFIVFFCTKNSRKREGVKMMYTQLIADIVSVHSDSMERIASRSTGVTSSISSIFPIIISIAVIIIRST